MTSTKNYLFILLIVSLTGFFACGGGDDELPSKLEDPEEVLNNGDKPDDDEPDAEDEPDDADEPDDVEEPDTDDGPDDTDEPIDADEPDDVDEPDSEEEPVDEEEPDNEDGPDDDDNLADGPNNDVSVLVSKFYHNSALTVVVTADMIIITSKGEPDHKSMYYNKTHPLYEDYKEPNNPKFKQNPNKILTQNMVFKIPRYPVEAAIKKATVLGPMGIAINSVALFNQNAGPGDDIMEELHTFDQYEGHPQQSGMYHYHLEPVYLTQKRGDDAFLGFLLDGFPVYGPVENGKRLTNDDLDDYHGHFGKTAEFPNGIYHYHVTDALPWINGDGYFGTPGTATY